MARVQYGTIITEIKGKIQGQVFQGGNVGFVLRNKGYTKGLSTPRKQGANNVIIAASGYWSQLNDTERGEWETAAPTWVFYNRFGAAYTGSGYQFFMAFQCLYFNYWGFFEPTPPAVVVPTDPGTKSLGFSISTGLELSWANNGGANDIAVFFASAGISPGRNANYVRLKRLGAVSVNGIDSYDLTTLYTNVYNYPIAGQRVVVRSFFSNNGWVYPYYDTNTSCLVTA